VSLVSDSHDLEFLRSRASGLNHLVLTLDLLERVAEIVEATDGLTIRTIDRLDLFEGDFQCRFGFNGRLLLMAVIVGCHLEDTLS
jgi:hypothetical protein